MIPSKEDVELHKQIATLTKALGTPEEDVIIQLCDTVEEMRKNYELGAAVRDLIAKMNVSLNDLTQWAFRPDSASLSFVGLLLHVLRSAEQPKPQEEK